MKGLALMTGLKLKLLLRRPLLLAICLIVPILLSLLAGATAVRNDLSVVQAAYVDLADNQESHNLTRMLESSKLAWQQLEEKQIDRALELGQLDGVVVIPAEFGDRASSRHLDEVYACVFIPGKDSLTAELVRNNYQVTALALSTVAKLEKDLLSLPDASGITEQEMTDLLKASTREARRDGAELTIDFHHLERGDSLPVIHVPDVAVEVMFLSVFSLLSSLMLTDAAARRRMRSLPGGFPRDYLSTLFALILSGLVQLASMTGLTLLVMPGTSRPSNYLPVMAVLLLFMLAFGQLMALIPGDRRFVPASLILFVSVFIGGVLIRLPTLWMELIGQYTPHGWAMAELTGMGTTVGLAGAAGTGLLLLLLAYVMQRRSEFMSN